MDGFGLDKKEVQSIVSRGMKWKERDREIWHARMMGTEVVFGREEQDIVIITIYREGKPR